MNKVLILNRLMEYKNFKTKIDFANFLGISNQNLSAWFSRNTYNINILLGKMPELSTDWLLTGEGSMFKKSLEDSSSFPSEIAFDPSALQNEIKKMQEKQEELNKKIEIAQKQFIKIQLGNLKTQEELHKRLEISQNQINTLLEILKNK